MPSYRLRLALLAALATLPLVGAQAQQAQTPPAPTPPTAPPPAVPPALAPPGLAAPPDLGVRVGLEPKAIDLLKAMSARLAAARTMSFTAIATYESPARTGEPLAYTTTSQVTLQRPDRLRVLTPGDGPPSEFYYDGKAMMAYSPEANLVAVSAAPPTIDAMLKAAFQSAAIYFPFTDVIVTDPYKDIAEGLKIAFVVGQSKVVGGTTTDVIVLVNDNLQAQVWIGAADRLPRMVRATFFNEPGHYRHVVEFTNWHLDGAVPSGTFASARAAKAPHMQFAAPNAKLPELSQTPAAPPAAPPAATPQAPAGGNKP